MKNIEKMLGLMVYLNEKYSRENILIGCYIRLFLDIYLARKIGQVLGMAIVYFS